jgi:hypothetical protein
MAENKSNKQYLSKSLTNFWTHDAERTASQTSHVFESLLLTAKMFCQLASPAKVLFLISGPTGVVF